VKLAKLLQYWIKHNEEHARTYLEWSNKADSEGLRDVAGLLQEASEKTMSINEFFEKAMKRLTQSARYEP
jgi:rubrerythrin